MHSLMFCFRFARFFSLCFFSDSNCNGNFRAAFHDLEMSSDAWPNLRLNNGVSIIQILILSFFRYPFRKSPILSGMLRELPCSNQKYHPHNNLALLSVTLGFRTDSAPNFLSVGHFTPLQFDLPPDPNYPRNLVEETQRSYPPLLWGFVPLLSGHL